MMDTQATFRFDGPDLTERDTERLGKQLGKVRDLMLDGRFRTHEEIARDCGLKYTAGISARVRDLKKARFGGYHVEKRLRAEGLYEYRVVVRQ